MSHSEDLLSFNKVYWAAHVNIHHKIYTFFDYLTCLHQIASIVQCRMFLLNDITVCFVFETSSFTYQTCTAHSIFCITLVTPYLNYNLYFSVCFNYMASQVSLLLKKTCFEMKTTLSRTQDIISFYQTESNSGTKKYDFRHLDSDSFDVLTPNFRHNDSDTRT